MRRYFVVFISLIFLAACGTRQPRVPTITPDPAMLTANVSSEPTAEPTQTPTPTATFTPTPTITPTFTPTPRPEILPSAFYYIGAFDRELNRVEADGATESVQFDDAVEAYAVSGEVITFAANEILYQHDMASLETTELGSAPPNVDTLLIGAEAIIYLSENTIYASDLDGDNLTPRLEGGRIDNPRRADNPFEPSFNDVIRRLTLSPDGTTLAFEYDGVKTMPVTGDEEPTLIAEQIIPDLTGLDDIASLTVNYPLAWSPGGDYLVFEVMLYEESATTALNFVNDELITIVPPSEGGCCTYALNDALYTVSTVEGVLAVQAFFFGVEDFVPLYQAGIRQGFNRIENIYAPNNTDGVYVTGVLDGDEDYFLITSEEGLQPLDIGPYADINVWSPGGEGFLALYSGANVVWITAEGDITEIEAGFNGSDIIWLPAEQEAEDTETVGEDTPWVHPHKSPTLNGVR